MLVSQKELSNIIGISTRQIRELRSVQGMFNFSGQTKKYDLAASVQEYIRYKIECESGSGNAIYENERAEHEQAKKEITKLKLRRLRHELHEAADVEAVVGDMIIRFRSKLLSVPSKLSPQLIGVSSVNEIMGLLKQEMYDVLNELVAYNPDDYSPTDVIDDDEEEDEEEDSETDSEDM